LPLKAMLMNLLSIGAAFGLVVAVFQWGWLGGVIGLEGTGPIEAFLPVSSSRSSSASRWTTRSS